MKGRRRRHRWTAGRVARWIGLSAAVYLALAYLILPAFWRHYEHLPQMASMPKVSCARDGRPSDPLNVALVGAEADIQRAFAAAGWSPADPITLRSSVGIVEGVMLHRPDLQAPVSDLFVFDRRQDFAFQRDVGGSPRERNHVRLWRTGLAGDGGEPVWIVDAERHTLMSDLEAAGQLTALYFVTGVGPTLNAKTADGDRYFTDGELAVGVVAPRGAAGTAPVEKRPSPVPVVIKNQFWSWLRPALGAQ